MLPFENVKALPRAALITQPGSGCVCFWEKNLLAKRSPEKKTTTGHAYKQNGYGTRPRDGRSTLAHKQLNKSEEAIMWLYISYKPHKNGLLKPPARREFLFSTHLQKSTNLFRSEDRSSQVVTDQLQEYPLLWTHCYSLSHKNNNPT